jgi:hypothetical protein
MSDANDTPRQSRNTLGLRARLRILKKLETVCHTIEWDDGGDNGEPIPLVAQYDPGWNDVRVAQELGVTTSNVASVRNEGLGQVRPRAPVPLEDRVAALEEQVAKLMSGVGSLLN